MDNPDELFDVVDARDQVIGQAPRGIVHRHGLLHRAVHVLVSHPETQQVFLQQRSTSKDSAPGCWDSSASGHLDAGEGYAAAAARELAEELGVEATPELCMVLWLPAQWETGQEFVQVYRGWHPGPFRLHPTEIKDGRWFTPEQVTHRIREYPEAFAPCFRFIWRQLPPWPASA